MLSGVEAQMRQMGNLRWWLYRLLAGESPEQYKTRLGARDRVVSMLQEGQRTVHISKFTPDEARRLACALKEMADYAETQ
jgi:hypothetical protein